MHLVYVKECYVQRDLHNFCIAFPKDKRRNTYRKLTCLCVVPMTHLRFLITNHPRIFAASSISSACISARGATNPWTCTNWDVVPDRTDINAVNRSSFLRRLEPNLLRLFMPRKCHVRLQQWPSRPFYAAHVLLNAVRDRTSV